MTTSPSLTRDVANLFGDDPAPLFCQYPAELRPQPAYIELTEDGTVRADYSGEINGTPMRVAHGRDLQWDVDAQVSAQTLRALLADGSELMQLLQRVHAGHSVHWDGNNYRGRLTAAAEAASDLIEALLQDLDPSEMANLVRTEDWLFATCDLADHWPAGMSLDEAVAQIDAAAATDGVTYLDDVRTCLLDRAHHVAQRNALTGATKLGTEHLEALIAEGYKLDEDELSDLRAMIAAR